MDLINQFIENYKKKLTFYENLGRISSSQLEDALQSAGIRAMVTYRIKNPGRLKSKILRRNVKRTVPYKNMKEIYEDIADLCGIRVSLYLPGDRIKVDSLISDLFQVIERKQFPEQSKPPTYNKRFSGYWANHYRVHMKEEIVQPSEKRYCAARIEIQVASVLMHAWSEVEHDLVYKPMQGTLSEEELAILDELNGLVLTGEIALERIQNSKATFANQFELASYLYNYLSNNFLPEDIKLRMGNIELLFRFLSSLKILRAKDIGPIVKSVKFEKDKRTISQQIIDQIISGNEKRYQAYQKLRSDDSNLTVEHQEAINYFFGQWVPLENLLNRVTKRSSRSVSVFNINALKRLGVLDKECINQIAFLRKMRNSLIHDIEVPEASYIREQGEEAKVLLEKLTKLLETKTAEG